MTSPPGPRESKFLEIREDVSYRSVASEYYNEELHPTCADFRTASRLYLARLFETERPSGRISDLGCGRSLVLELAFLTRASGLVLVDNSMEMLAHNEDGLGRPEMRLVDVESESFGREEFDWIFAILGDAYNSLNAWQNICRALRGGGQCIFIVPSSRWAEEFRSHNDEERPGFAKFVSAAGTPVFLPSKIFAPQEQEEIIKAAGISLVSVDQVRVADMPMIKSPKISEFLEPRDPVLDIYRTRKEFFAS